MKPLIVILDYDIGNVCSIQNMLKKIGEKAIISRDIDAIEAADKVILPGVGKYDTAMERLSNYGLVKPIQEHCQRMKPLLGICLGMQLLGRRSEEGLSNGLGLIPFDVVRFIIPNNSELKVPHMGWDTVTVNACDPLTEGLSDDQRYYFVHSYHAVCDSKKYELMTCEYGYRFSAAVKLKNVYGVQFHPEKSHQFGLALLRNFVERV